MGCPDWPRSSWVLGTEAGLEPMLPSAPGRHRNGEENGNQRIVTPSKPGARPVLKGTELTSAQAEPRKRAKWVHRRTDTLVVRTVTCDNLDSGYDNIFL